MHKVTLRTLAKRASVLVAFVIAAVAAQTAAAGDPQQDNPILMEGNPKCVEIGYEAGFKPTFGGAEETPPLGDPVTVSNGELEITIQVTGTNADGEATVISWSSNVGVDAVIMKGGPNGFVYVYDPPTEATSGSGLTTPTNNGGNRPEISHVEFCYDAEGGQLEIEKTASTSSYLEYQWKIDKTVDREQIALAKEPAAAATYTITVERDEGTVHGWSVWGDITVSNTTDSSATIVSVTDSISDFGAVDVHCDAPEFPLELAPGGTLSCYYGPISLPDGTKRTNTATVATSGDGRVSGASHVVPVTFGNPTVLNGQVTVTDDYATPDFGGDDQWWEFGGSDTVTYERTFWCKDAGKHINTAWLSERQGLEHGPQLANLQPEPQPKSAQATVLVHCDTKSPPVTDSQSLAGPSGQSGAGSAAPVSERQRASSIQTGADPACIGADAVRGSRGDSAWGLVGPKRAKTAFFLSKRSYWRVLRLGHGAKNPYFRLGSAYIMVKLHRLNGSPATPAVERAMNWARRYMFAHRPGYSKAGPNAAARRIVTVRKVRRVLRKHARTLKRYARGIDATRCAS